MLSFLAEYRSAFEVLGLFDDLISRSIGAGVTALILGFLIAPKLFAKLRALKLSQFFRKKEEVGKLADLHSSKKNTPTMGGFMIYLTVIVGTLLWARPNIYIIALMVIYTALTIIGFMDDYLKVSGRSSRGLGGYYKIFGQALIVFITLTLLLLASESSAVKMRELWIPFFTSPVIKSMPLVVLFLFLFLVLSGSSNAVNLTDGLDGLAIGCTITVASAYGVMAYVAGDETIASTLSISHIPGVGELTVVCAALVGASLAFLWHNAYPAAVFMGDTGSLAIGGLIGGIAFMTHQPFTLIIVGGVFVMEALSVIIQVGSFKTRGKRIFKMSPIHHHFELKGWPETKVVIRFWILSVLFAVGGLMILKLN